MTASGSYAVLVAHTPALIVLTLDTREPIEIADFVSAFTSLSNQYEKFIKAFHPEAGPDADIYIKEVRPGSIQADLIPWALATLAPLSDQIQREIVKQFVRFLGDRISSYFKIGGRAREANKSDLSDFIGAVQAIANDPNGSSKIEAADFADGKKKITAALKFTTPQAKRARAEIEHHMSELLDRTESADYKRVMMVFVQSNTKDLEVGRRTGERVIIESISKKDLGLIYASELAERRIKHEIREGDDNIYKKGFIVDVNVQLHNGKPAAYRIVQFHDVIDLPD